MKIEKINNLSIAYDLNDVILHDYIEYCVSLFKKYISYKNINIILGNFNINLNNLNIDFNNNNDIIKIDFQIEHTLIIPGTHYSYSETAIKGGIKINNCNQNYLIRIQKYNYNRSMDYIIEYSTMNIANIKSNSMFIDYLEKVICISPLIYENIEFNKNNRDGIITSFINDNPRRLKLKNEIKQCNFKYENIRCFNKENIREIYKRNKILINIHQTDNSHTLEELRILPALECGIIVISEDCPIKESIPYYNHVIWSSYDDIIKTTQDVLNNYDKYYDKIFNNELLDIFNNINISNKKSIIKI